MTIHRARFYIRHCGTSRSSCSAYSIKDERDDFALIGTVEVEENDSYADQMMMPFIAHCRASSLDFIFTGAPYPISPDYALSDLGGLATEEIWSRPDALSGLMGGSLLLRRTRAPAPTGRSVMTALIVASLPAGSLHDGHLIEGQGNAGLEHFPVKQQRLALNLHTGKPADLPLGVSLSQILKLPFWGWESEHYAFRSTLGLEIIDACTTIGRLRAADHLTEEELDELARIEGSAIRFIVQNTAQDPKYAEFKKRIVAECGPAQWDAVDTAEMLKERDALADRVMREILNL